MAEYLTQFSCLLDVLTPENARAALALYTSGSEVSSDQPDYTEGFTLRISEDLGGHWLWMTDGGMGDVEALIAFVKYCATSFGLSGLWGFQYANTCSRPRPDGFGGGAHVLDLSTGGTIDWTHSGDWLSAALAGGQANA